MVLSGLALIFLLPPLRIQPRPETDSEETLEVGTGGAHLLLVAWVANFSAYFAINGITNQLPYLGEKHLGIDLGMVGLLALSLNLARFGGSSPCAGSRAGIIPRPGFFSSSSWLPFRFLC